MNADRPGTSRSDAGPAGAAVAPSLGSATPCRAATCSRDCSSRPPAAAEAPTTSNDPAPTRNDRLLATSNADTPPVAAARASAPPVAPSGAAAAGAGAPGRLVTSGAQRVERQARTASVATPARTPARPTTAGRQAAVPGGRAPAQAPSAPNAASPTTATQRRRRAASARPTPNSRDRTTTPATSAGLSREPSVAMAARTTPIGARSITTLAIDCTSDGAPGSAPATSSVAPSATAAATAPASACRPPGPSPVGPPGAITGHLPGPAPPEIRHAPRSPAPRRGVPGPDRPHPAAVWFTLFTHSVIGQAVQADVRPAEGGHHGSARRPSALAEERGRHLERSRARHPRHVHLDRGRRLLR